MSTISAIRNRKTWSQEEDNILRREALNQAQHGKVRDWKAIAARIPERSNKDCRKRWIKLDSPAKKGSWSYEEDERLRKAVGRHSNVWNDVAKVVVTRNADQCAKRWLHFINPELNHSEWTKQEDTLLLTEVQRHGRNWRKIVDEVLEGRSATDAKNRYAILERSGPNKAPTTRRDRGHEPRTIKVSSTDMDGVEASRQSTTQNILGNSMGDRFGLENGDVNLIPEAELIFDPLGDTAVMNQGLGDLAMLDWSIPEQTDLLSPNSLGSSVYNHPSTDAIPGYNHNFWGNPREGFMSNLIGDRLYDQLSPLPHLESPTVSDMNKSITASTTRRDSDIFCNDEDEEGEENDDSEDENGEDADTSSAQYIPQTKGLEASRGTPATSASSNSDGVCDGPRDYTMVLQHINPDLVTKVLALLYSSDSMVDVKILG